jgi:hypothetical protein
MKKLKILFVLAIVGAFLISAGAVYASSYGGAWVASVGENVITISLEALGDNQTFGVYDIGGNVGSDNVILLTNLDGGAIFTVTFNDGDFILSADNGNTINLGATGEFGFFYTDVSGPTVYYTSYGLSTKSENGWYALTRSGFPAVYVSGADPVNASHTPLPPSAFLLGSGIVGLIGFGLSRRRNRFA